MRAFRPLLVALLCLTYFAVPTFARRVITVTEKMSGGFGAGAGSTSNLSTYTTSDTFELAADTVGLCFVGHGDSDAAETIGTFTHNSVTWTEITTQLYTGTSIQRITAFWKAGAQASSAVAVAITGADAQIGMAIACYEVAGADTTTPVIQFQEGALATVTAHTITMDGGRTDNSVLVFGLSASTNETWTPEYAGVGTNDIVVSAPDIEMVVQWDIDGADTTPLITSGTTSTSGMIAVEIAVAGAAAATAKGLLLMGCCDRRPN
jgi:hypothetical protein